MRISDTLRFKRDIVDLTRKHKSTYTAMMLMSFKGAASMQDLTDLERNSLSNVIDVGVGSLPDADAFFVGRNVVKEYLNRSLGPEPIQFGSVYPYTKSGLVVFENPIVLDPASITAALESEEQGEKSKFWNMDAVKFVPVSAVSWSMATVPVSSYATGRQEILHKPGVVIMLWTNMEDVRSVFEQVSGTKLEKAYFPIYPLSYASAAFGGWFIAETGLTHPDEDASTYYDGDSAFSAAEATAVVLVHTLWAMLEERIFVSAKQSMSSKYMKMMRRLNMNANVSVINLRQIEYVDGYDGNMNHLIDWSHRWRVRGHYRRITDRVTGEQKLVWVRAHIKGPEEKPLRDTEKINALLR